jgi:hypothetical protein
VLLLDLLDPDQDPLVRCTDPAPDRDPSIITKTVNRYKKAKRAPHVEEERYDKVHILYLVYVYFSVLLYLLRSHSREILEIIIR